MRPWLISLMAVSFLAVATTGCQTFQNPFSGKKSARGSSKSLFGVKRRTTADSLSPDDALDPLGARDSNRLLIDDLSPSQLGTTFKTRFSSEVDAEKATAYFNEGQRLFQAGTAELESNAEGNAHQDIFAEAANQFRLASAAWPDSETEEQATFYEGESYFFADRYVQANRAFEKLVANYSGSRYLDLAENRRYAIAIYWLQLSESSNMVAIGDAKRPKTKLASEARRVLHQIQLDDPTGDLADDATLTLGKAFMQSQRYYEAAQSFEDLRMNYPASKHQFEAHMLELQARLASYQGKSYDDTPLKKADELMKAIARQFPKEAQEQLPYLSQQATMIRNQTAERDLLMAEYFEGRGENLAAQYYYQKVAKKYDNTDLGKTVNERIAEISTKPPRPDQPMKWFVDLFPDPEAAKPLIAAGDNESILRR